MSSRPPRDPRRRPPRVPRDPPRNSRNEGQPWTHTTSIDPRTSNLDPRSYGSSAAASGERRLAAAQPRSFAPPPSLMPPPPPRSSHQPSIPPEELMPPPPRQTPGKLSVPTHSLMPTVATPPRNQSAIPPHSLMQANPSCAFNQSLAPIPPPLSHGTSNLQSNPRIPAPTSTGEERPWQYCSEAARGEITHRGALRGQAARGGAATGGTVSTAASRTEGYSPLQTNPMEVLYTRDIKLLEEIRVETAMYDLACLEKGWKVMNPEYQGMDDDQIHTHARQRVVDGKHKIEQLEQQLLMMGVPPHSIDERRFNLRLF